jgi:hypothetical protein
MIFAPNSAACIDVPHPVSTRLRIELISASFESNPPSTTLPPFMRAPKLNARAIASGCSRHSFNVK